MQVATEIKKLAAEIERNSNKKPSAEATKRWWDNLAEAGKKYSSLENEWRAAAKNRKKNLNSHASNKCGDNTYGWNLRLLFC